MQRRALVCAFGTLPFLPSLAVGAATPIHVYKTASCESAAPAG